MNSSLLQKLTASPGKTHSTGDFSTSYTASWSKKHGLERLERAISRMRDLQDKLFALDRHSVLIIFQALDAAGKDGTIEHVMTGINPQGCQVFTFKEPSTEELDHGFLWRIYRDLPERGRIGIFNRSHYEEVIVTKVHPELLLDEKLVDVDDLHDVDADFWSRRYRQINDFERYLTETGTEVIKFFLNVSRHEQHKRFRDRLQDPAANWKFSLADVRESEFWDSYQRAYSDMLTHTSTALAPWYVIPADHKWFMRAAVAEIICERLGRLGLHYPELSEQQQQDLHQAMKEIDTVTI